MTVFSARHFLFFALALATASPAMDPPSAECGPDFAALAAGTRPAATYDALVKKLDPSPLRDRLTRLGPKISSSDEAFSEALTALNRGEAALTNQIRSHLDPLFASVEVVRELRDLLGQWATLPENQHLLTGRQFATQKKALGHHLQRSGKQISRLDCAKLTGPTRQRLRTHAVAEIRARFAREKIGSAIDLGPLENSRDPAYGETLLAVQSELYRHKRGFTDARDRFADIDGQIATLFHLSEDFSYWSQGRMARLVMDTIALNDDDYRALLDRGAIAPDLAHGKPVTVPAPMEMSRNFYGLMQAGVTEAGAREQANKVFRHLNEIGTEAGKVLAKSELTAKDEEWLRAQTMAFMEGKGMLDTPMVVDRGSEMIRFPINLTGTGTITAQLFRRARSSLEGGSLTLALSDPNTVTVHGKKLTAEQRREVWKLNMAIALEEHIHLVQFLRDYGGVASTQANVSAWARALKGTAVHHEADAYARNVEWLGPLDPVFLGAYGERNAVPRALARLP